MEGLKLAEKVRSATLAWREGGYKDASAVTRRLLEFWFLEEHWLRDQSQFEFWRAQREAIESLIYLYEVCGYDSLYGLSRGFRASLSFDPTTDNWPKYCFKMATGSGKTFVMALAMVWQYFNAFLRTDNKRRYTAKFVLIAPNLIVLDRLSEAFADGTDFRKYPFLPPEWEADFDLQMVFQSQVRPMTSFGILYLTNVQQLYEAPEQETLNALAEALGPPVVRDMSLSRADLQEALQHHDNFLVLNDEAHHVHSDDLEWSKAIANLHEGCQSRGGNGLTMQLDFSATPFRSEGSARDYFAHIIYDYPLRDAIRDGIVKRPKIGEIENAPEPPTENFVKRNQLQIDTGVQIYRESLRDLKEVGKKPVLFVMTDNTRNADDVGKHLRSAHALSTLVIHTDSKGVITKKDLATAREAARSIDRNEFQAIVSVMMLKEGWDVKNVTVVIPLRSYQSLILAEQTLGRGLRRMFPGHGGTQEKLIVIDHPRFRELWKVEIKEQELDIEIVAAKEVYKPENLVRVDASKLKYDIELPVLTGGLTRDVRQIQALDVSSLARGLFRFGDLKLPKVMYRQKDLLTQKVEVERELTFDYTDDGGMYLSFLTKAILSCCGASAYFAEVLPKVREYIETRLFDVPVSMDDVETVKKLNDLGVRAKVHDLFRDAILRLEVAEEPLQLTESFRVSSMEPFHTSEPVYQARKSVFECLPYASRSEFERRFMMYLDEQEGVEAFTKVLSRMPLRIPYHSAEGYLRHYVPDFVVKTAGHHWVVDTKGAGWGRDVDVPRKRAAATGWCQRVSEVTSQEWSFAQVDERDFQRMSGLSFDRLMAAAQARPG